MSRFHDLFRPKYNKKSIQSMNLCVKSYFEHKNKHS
nr:MAG TPA: hypothetical protein [Caudoviricetes sp.]